MLNNPLYENHTEKSRPPLLDTEVISSQALYPPGHSLLVIFTLNLLWFLPMVTFYLLTTVLHNPRVTECPLISAGLHVLSCTYVYGYRAMRSYHIGEVLEQASVECRAAHHHKGPV